MNTVILTFSTPQGFRTLPAKSGSPKHVAAALRLAGADWVLVRVEREEDR